jgi:tetratricopeptide (TPR) repeat protein
MHKLAVFTAGRAASAMLAASVLVVGSAVLMASACAPVIVPAPVVTSPKFPEFVMPVVPAELSGTAAAINESRGWAFLQSGDLKTAEHEFMAALRNDPRFFPADVSLGYLDLARKDVKSALPRFDAVLDRRHDDVSALFGRGQALLAMSRDGEALTAFEAVLAVDPGQTEVRRRVDVLKFRVLEQEIAHARQAAKAGHPDEASQAYEAAIAGQPESPFLYRELAAVEREQGKLDEAIAHYRKSVALDPADARSLAQIGEILEARGDFDGAARAYADALEIEPGNGLEEKLERLHSRAALDRLPAEYRAIEEAPQVTRADLAALIGIRLGPLLQAATTTDAALITDARNSWALTWIMAVTRAGVMEPFANHAFQPRTVVRRADLAQASARLLRRVGALHPAAAKAWESARVQFSDLAPGHLAYPAASAVVAAAIMTPGPDNSFQPSRAVTGAEAIAAIAKLGSLADLK